MITQRNICRMNLIVYLMVFIFHSTLLVVPALNFLNCITIDYLKKPLQNVLYFTYFLSQCSASCGRGFEKREFRCSVPRGEPFFDCGPSPPDEQRFCHGTFRRHDTLCYKPKPCRRDASIYCSLTNLLGRYCVIPGFRKFCCKSCSLTMNMLPE